MVYGRQRLADLSTPPCTRTLERRDERAARTTPPDLHVALCGQDAEGLADRCKRDPISRRHVLLVGQSLTRVELSAADPRTQAVGKLEGS